VVNVPPTTYARASLREEAGDRHDHEGFGLP
jgi:hypothetical protein